jgi:hypothetical protein
MTITAEIGKGYGGYPCVSAAAKSIAAAECGLKFGKLRAPPLRAGEKLLKICGSLSLEFVDACFQKSFTDLSYTATFSSGDDL